MEIKLPSPEEKFVVMDEDSDIFHEVVSGVHIQLRGDEKVPGFVWYCVCADKVHDGLFRGKRCLHVAMFLEYALDYIAQQLVPYEERVEETADVLADESIVEGGNSDGQEDSDRRGRSEGDSRVQEETGLLVTADHDCRKYAGCRHAPIGAAKDTLGVPAHLGGVSFA